MGIALNYCCGWIPPSRGPCRALRALNGFDAQQLSARWHVKHAGEFGGGLQFATHKHHVMNIVLVWSAKEDVTRSDFQGWP
eukprot:CAMPEP_0115359098 /NCGR_PEP_ID=MMETSP0270-20121206/100996_1 /TAXON_ID=71861 /ORGANISM="Scrippsiella trochoidea, Strain CCMP3099" /LENGTH=80 /DNA_ID=CAMNT_0002781591 /DNA_START=762 /DNA_END=1004 /DNA_ORIENTATION=+